MHTKSTKTQTSLCAQKTAKTVFKPVYFCLTKRFLADKSTRPNKKRFPLLRSLLNVQKKSQHLLFFVRLFLFFSLFLLGSVFVSVKSFCKKKKANRFKIVLIASITYITHIVYLDANNLYDYAMYKFLPTNQFKRIYRKECDLNEYTSNSSKGYIL